MSTIYLIGGGEINKNETKDIDLDFLEASGGSKARLLFFPTAAFDSESYIKIFKKYFTALGCENIKFARLSKEPMESVRKKIDWSTGIYLGGGSTEELMRAFKSSDIINYFNLAIASGKILAGMSAGAMCLGKIAIFSEIKEKIKLGGGLGLLSNVIVIAHFSLKYQKKFSKLKNKFNNCHVFGIPEKSAILLKKSNIEKINNIYELKKTV